MSKNIVDNSKKQYRCPTCFNIQNTTGRCGLCKRVLSEKNLYNVSLDKPPQAREKVSESVRICPKCGSKNAFTVIQCPNDGANLMLMPLIRKEELALTKTLILYCQEKKVPLFIVTKSEMIGRSQTGQSILSEDVYVSRNHAQIQFQNNNFWIRNLSKNGTNIDGKKIENWHKLENEQTLILGRTTFMIKVKEDK